MNIDEFIRTSDDATILAWLQSEYDRDSDSEVILCWLAAYRRHSLLGKAVNMGLSIHKAEPRFGRTPIHEACGKGKIVLIKTLLELGADINARDAKGLLPIEKSAGTGKLNEVKFLHKHGSELDGALPAAVDGKYAKIVAFLLEQQVDTEDTNAKHHNMTPLMLACSSDSKKAAQIVDMLLDACANVNAQRDGDGMSPLLFAACESTPEVIHRLVKAGADVNLPMTSGQTPLMLASAENDRVVPTLLDLGADYHLKGHSGNYKDKGPLDVAREYRRRKLVAFYEEIFGG